MSLSTEQLKLILVNAKILAASKFNEAVKEAKAQKLGVYEFLIQNELVEDAAVGKAFSEHFNVDFADLVTSKVDSVVLKSIPKLVCEKQGVIAFGRTQEGVLLGMLNPHNITIRNFIEKRMGQPIIVNTITPYGFQSALKQYEVEVDDSLREIISKLEDETLAHEERDDYVVQAVKLLLQYGYKSKASDIHIEPYKEKILVRFRIDGMMHDVLEIPKTLLEVMVTRIKILSRLRTDEHLAAQDGKLQFTVGGEVVDVRVSIVPVTAGENVVMRILSSKSREFTLESLGFLPEDLGKTDHAIQNPHGMILVTGPTGSGKTTTLYAVLKILNKREVHISTIEDPVEFDIDGISQIQVNSKTNLTFAEGLRALVRQDPDIIMVGEIRDKETAGIAVNSAMTGHLVLSTLHANNAATSLPRLLDMGIEPFLVASTVNIVIAQRLVRKLCQHCRVEKEISEDVLKIIESESTLQELIKQYSKKSIKTLKLFQGVGCNECGGTGYQGRLGIFEVLEMSEEVKQLVLQRQPSDDIMDMARKKGMTTMLEDGIKKVFNGTTTLSEVLRVTRE